MEKDRHSLWIGILSSGTRREPSRSTEKNCNHIFQQKETLLGGHRTIEKVKLAA